LDNNHSVARHPRNEGAGALHHVVAQAPSDGRIVRDDSDRLHLLDELRLAAGVSGWQCIAYGVMETHLHLVLCTPEPNLARRMNTLLGRYSFAHNRRHGRRGHLFSDRYWSRRIDKPHYLCCAALYAVLNPVKAGLCTHPSEFAWSSYGETAGLRPTDFIEPEPLLRTLAEDQEAARQQYRAIVDTAVQRLHRRRIEEAWWKTVAQVVDETRTPA
jgi:putative transposase